MAFDLQIITHASAEERKREIARFWPGIYEWMTLSRLSEPWGEERYMLIAAYEDDRCAGTTGALISKRGQATLTQVFTHSDYRGRGVAKLTLRKAMEIFREEGARVIFLAAWEEWIWNIYEKVGFTFAGRMGQRHAFKCVMDPSGSDENLFRPGQKTEIRPMRPDDQCDLASLFVACHSNVVKHYGLGCFLGSYFEGEFFTLMQQKDNPTQRAIVLDGEETIAGFATILPSTRRHEDHGGILDILVHPHYSEHERELLDRLESENVLEHLDVYIAPSETERRAFFESSGYQRLVRLERQLKIQPDYYDLDLYRKSR